MGFRTEDGPRPDFAERFGARERGSDAYEERTVANVREADGTLILADDRPGPGTALTILACEDEGKPYRVVPPDRLGDREIARTVPDWIIQSGIGTLNVAGERESSRPGIGERAERFLMAVFGRVLASDDSSGSRG